MSAARLDADRRAPARRGRGARRRPDRARHLVADAGDRGRLGSRRARTSFASARAVRISRRCRRRWSPAARLYVDSSAAALVESGDIVMNIAAGLFDAVAHPRRDRRGRARPRARPHVRGRHHRSSSRSAWPWKTWSPPTSCCGRAIGNRSRNGADAMNGEPGTKKRRNVDSDRHRRRLLFVFVAIGVVGVVHHRVVVPRRA